MTRQGIFPSIMVLMVAVFAATGCASRPAADLYGQAVPANPAMRTVHITPSTHYVNVESGEAVRFVVDGKEFGWGFTTPPTVNHFDLNEVAPTNLLNRRVIAYVSPDPKYRFP
ncbi:CzcE family metal-binding protein [Noviherbaspirillum sp.]|uniref:CzcE family metal-binding protein n=1 Tax=Noviherbaspirillum sp. TaxID=1926288 RepID=UPI002B467F94|nr:CzcE family metal-binding protein [Noviherbaspirillum sp.]HJV79990.1 CzcE family metal-binding protein [Noviherbaspirillum sp.]